MPSYAQYYGGSAGWSESVETILQAITALGAGKPVSRTPLTELGKFSGPLFIGDDYLGVNARGFSWVIPKPVGVPSASGCECSLGFQRLGSKVLVVDGLVTDEPSNKLRLSFDVTGDQSSTIKPERYEWTVELRHNGAEITTIYGGDNLAHWKNKAT